MTRENNLRQREKIQTNFRINSECRKLFQRTKKHIARQWDFEFKDRLFTN